MLRTKHSVVRGFRDSVNMGRVVWNVKLKRQLSASTDGSARVVVVGSGRMGQIRSELLYSNPRFELCGIVDEEVSAAEQLASKYGVRFPREAM